MNYQLIKLKELLMTINLFLLIFHKHGVKNVKSFQKNLKN